MRYATLLTCLAFSLTALLSSCQTPAPGYYDRPVTKLKAKTGGTNVNPHKSRDHNRK